MSPTIEAARRRLLSSSTPAAAFLGVGGTQTTSSTARSWNPVLVVAIVPCSTSDETPRVIFQGGVASGLGGGAVSSSNPLPHERQLQSFRQSFNKALQLRDATQKRLEAKYDDIMVGMRMACQEFRAKMLEIDDSIAAKARSSYPKEMSQALRSFEGRVFPAFTALSVELRTAMEEYNHIVLTLPSPTMSSSTLSQQGGVGDAGDWHSVDGRVEAAEVTEATHMLIGAEEAPAAVTEEVGEYLMLEGTTRLELLARYLEELENIWVAFEIILEDMCDRLKVDSAKAGGVYKQVVTVGEIGAGVGIVCSVGHLIRAGSSPIGWTGLLASLLSLAGLERIRRELVVNAGQLQDLREKTRKLSKGTRLVVEGYRSMVLSGCGDVLDQYEARKDELRAELETLSRLAGAL